MSYSVDKHILESKTFWFSLITVLAPIIPGVEELVTANPKVVLGIIGIAGIILRKLTSGKVVLK